MSTKNDDTDLKLEPAALLAKCLAMADVDAAIALHERYFAHHHALRDKQLGDATEEVKAWQAEIAKLNAAMSAVRNDKMRVALADSSGREAIERHFAQCKAA